MRMWMPTSLSSYLGRYRGDVGEIWRVPQADARVEAEHLRRYRGDIGEIQGRYRGDMGEIQGRYRVRVEAEHEEERVLALVADVERLVRARARVRAGVERREVVAQA